MVQATSVLSKSVRRHGRRRNAAVSRGTARQIGSIDLLEARTLMSIAAVEETLVNISKMRENQTEGTIAIDPTNPNRLFASSNMGSAREPDLGPNDPIPTLDALFGATSTDGGVTWTTRTFASGPVGTGGDNLPTACCDPSAEFDQFGNLWFTYLGIPLDQPLSTNFHTIVLLSTDGGTTFSLVADLGGVDQPTITTGANSVWVSWKGEQGLMVASGATVTGLGVVTLPAGHTADPTGRRGPFIEPQSVTNSGPGNFGDIAIGPAGQVMLNYQDPIAGELPSEIRASVDPDGFGPQPFGPTVLVTNTNVGGFDLIPAQNRRSVDAEANIEWDRSGGPFHGRVYMAYTDEPQFESITGNTADLDVYVRFSDDNGVHWSERFLVNDDVGIGTPLPRAQFLPQIALDQTTGNIAIGFHDARNDTSADRNPNDDVQFFVAVGQPTADRSSIVFAPNVRVGVGQSDAKFADNSNSTRDNPAGARRSFDLYTGRVRVTDTTVPPPPTVTPNSPLHPTVIKENAMIKKGKFYNLTVQYTADAGAVIDVATLGDNDLTVTGPNGFTRNMELRGVKRKLRGQSAVAKYRVLAPGDDRFDVSENGLYTITLNADAVRASNNVGTTGGILSKFLVSVNPPRTRGRSLDLAAAPPAAAAEAAPRRDDGATALLTA